jgi:hypothetical protein
VPGGADLTAGVTGVEEPAELGVVGVVESFVGDGHQFADPVERVGLAASMPAGLVLHAPAGLVEHEVGEVGSD